MTDLHIVFLFFSLHLLELLCVCSCLCAQPSSFHTNFSKLYLHLIAYSLSLYFYYMKNGVKKRIRKHKITIDYLYSIFGKTKLPCVASFYFFIGRGGARAGLNGSFFVIVRKTGGSKNSPMEEESWIPWKILSIELQVWNSSILAYFTSNFWRP